MRRDPSNIAHDLEDREIGAAGTHCVQLSGRMEAEHATELERLFGPRTDYGDIIVDLKELRLADRAAVRFLARCEVVGLKLENCPAYIRESMEKEKQTFGPERRNS